MVARGTGRGNVALKPVLSLLSIMTVGCASAEAPLPTDKVQDAQGQLPSKWFRPKTFLVRNSALLIRRSSRRNRSRDRQRLGMSKIVAAIVLTLLAACQTLPSRTDNVRDEDA